MPASEVKHDEQVRTPPKAQREEAEDQIRAHEQESRLACGDWSMMYADMPADLDCSGERPASFLLGALRDWIHFWHPRNLRKADMPADLCQSLGERPVAAAASVAVAGRPHPGRQQCQRLESHFGPPLAAGAPSAFSSSVRGCLGLRLIHIVPEYVLCAVSKLAGVILPPQEERGGICV